MTDIREVLEERNLPELLRLASGETVKNPAEWKKRREEIKEILSSQFAGYPPGFPATARETVTLTDEQGYGGKAIVNTVLLDIRSAYSAAQFSFRIALPKQIEKPPLFLYLAFTPEIADGLGEEILDRGYGVASIYYQDMAPDYYDNHQNGLGRFCTCNPFDSWGKLRIWAYGASAVLDCILKRKWADPAKIAVMGHSRLGKTALVAGAFDQRFSMAAANESGAGGAALFRGKMGESIENLYGKGSRLWFAGNFFQYREDPRRLPFDQHFLLALLAPRYLYVASAEKDHWSDPQSEFLGCIAAGDAFELYGKKGLVAGDSFPAAGDICHEGHIGYHIRRGSHYLSRYDWQQIIAYRDKHHI